MESETPDDRPESPKKKIRPSSTTNSDVQDCHNATGCTSISTLSSEMNGLAPTRKFREAEASSSSEKKNSPIETSSIQEEVVSSSENSVGGHSPVPTSNMGNADSLTNDSEDSNHLEREANELSLSSEAEHKEL